MIPFRASVELIGRIGVDPQQKKYTTDKKAEQYFWLLKVGVDRKSAEKMPNGDMRKADWFDVIGNMDCSQLEKGDAVKIVGTLTQRIWLPKNGDPTNKNDWVTSYQVRAEKISRVEDDQVRGIETIQSSSLAPV